MDTPRISIIGVGNADCGDDGIGPAIVDQLERDGNGHFRFIKTSGEPSGLIEVLSGTDSALLIDAIASHGHEGRIHRFDASSESLPAEYFTNYSTHSMGVNEAIEMARVLGDLPETTIVYGMEASSFDPGASMSVAVRNQLPELLRVIRKELSRLGTS